MIVWTMSGGPFAVSTGSGRIMETLWDTAPHNQTSTSIAAAHELTDAVTLRERVYDAIAAAPAGLTREELERVTGLSGNTVRPRVWELVRAGRITTCGTRPTTSGRRAAVLIAGRA